MRQLLVLLAFGAWLTVTPLRATPAVPPQPDPAAARAAILISVSMGGVQRVTGAALAAAGFDLTQLDPAHLWLRRAGRPVPLELRDGGDGRLDPADELRFYAPPPGDRWNAADSYWLTAEATAAPTLLVRSVAPGSAPELTSARERGLAYTPAYYDSRRPGPDGDQWFAADLRADVGATAVHTLTLAPNLPPAAGDATLTVTGQLYQGTAVHLDVQLGGATAAELWSGQGFGSSTFALPDGATALTITLGAGDVPTGVLLDRVSWERPALLVLGGRGARFSGVTGSWRYTLTAPPTGWSLYDVTEPEAPQRLDLGGATLSFEDGPSARDYLVSGPGTLYAPALAPWHASDIAAPRAATVVYIVPAALREALAPLVTQRQHQGYAVAVVNVEELYAAWSYGAVAPEAIRSFLRYAAATWPQHLTTAILVGDGTADPHDWTARGPNNVNHIPPYLALVDPWLGEAACDTCYGRLATDDPRAAPLPDLAIGRLPVKSAAELTRLVSKLIAYDAEPATSVWRGTVALVADNPDTAGDFFVASEAAAALLPPGLRLRRVYYDPTSARGPASAAVASEQTRAAFNAGAALVLYHGHSHQWQWALTDPSADRSALLGLYDPDSMSNATRLPVVLAMTCLSSAFQTPAISGTTVDERLVLADGGAVAVWGPAGFGVSHGHDLLERGFIEALRAAPGGTAPLGALTMAGYRALAAGGVASDSLFTYTLLGDPLTLLHLNTNPLNTVMLPLVRR